MFTVLPLYSRKVIPGIIAITNRRMPKTAVRAAGLPLMSRSRAKKVMRVCNRADIRKEKYHMRKSGIVAVIVLLFSLPAAYGYGAQRVSLWERMCEACHDGNTVLNGKVVIDKEQLKKKYRTLDELVKAVTCEGPPCMNILKHDKKLVREVGEEIGIGDSRR
jgi:hypothetical protein